MKTKQLQENKSNQKKKKKSEVVSLYKQVKETILDIFFLKVMFFEFNFIKNKKRRENYTQNYE